MENRRTFINILSIITVILSILAFIICMGLNLPDVEMGSLATTTNVIVTFSYIATWIQRFNSWGSK